MLEGAVARIFNQLLGKYVVDLDTENLNVGIFSGHVQLTDLKLKPEALYELNLPIEVKAGTIGKVWVQIPWTSLWNQPVVVNIEDLHIIVNPIVTFEPFDEEKNKRLLRAFKKKILEALDVDKQIIGGPSSFSEHLLANILNNLQLTITNIHVRYEDDVSCKRPLAAGLCIGSITAETTNSKWKAVKSENLDTCYYLIKMESFFIYWNHEITPVDWNLPSQYYKWRNSMSDSLKNFSMNNQDFEFLLKPMTVKIKMTINKANTGNVSKITSDLIIQDCNLQLSKEQFNSISSVTSSLSRMFISWNFFAERPKGRILENIKDWWKYAYKALLEQRIRPYTWSRIKSIRQHYKNYVETYKQIILNPNDTELKLDAQILEDQLSVINIVIGRQQARLLVQSRSMSEKNFWSSLPSPERTILCEKIGLSGKTGDSFLSIDHKYNMRIGNVSVSVTNQSKEILNITLTQCIGLYKPDFLQDTYKMLLKVEGLIVEGCNMEENLTSIVSSEHLSNSPAYFLKIELEKFSSVSKCSYKFDMAMDSVEFIHHKQSIEELLSFFNLQYFTLSVEENLRSIKQIVFNFIEEKLVERWEFNLNIKIPYLVFPENGCLTRSENILIIDFGRYVISTELCQKTDVIENATQMELEELLYSKLKINCSDLQVLFCDNGDNWKDAMKEKDTDLHFIPKTSFSALYARCLKKLKTLPHYKFNINFQTFKFNLSERRLSLFFKFFNIPPDITLEPKTTSTIFLKDSIKNKLGQKYLLHVQNAVSIEDSFIKTKRGKMDRNQNYSIDKAKIQEKNNKNDMNEAYARYVDLPGLEDNISPHNNITILFRFVLNEFSVIYYRSSDSTDRQYLMFRLGMFVMDVALMTYGPAYQISLGSILLTDKLHTTGSGQYLDLMHSPVPSSVEVLTILYRKVSASCPDFWTHFHGVETSLVADIGTIYFLLHQEAINTLIKYSKYIQNKIVNQLPEFLLLKFQKLATGIQDILHKKTDTPVPPGSVKFSHSARLADLNVKICDSDYDIVNIQLSALEMDFLFRANERFVFRSYLSNINVEHLSDDTLYSKVLSTDQDKVFEVKYVRHAANLIKKSDISSNIDDVLNDGSFKLNLGQIHITFLYKLIVQLQRFLLNLDAVPFIEKGLKCIHSSITKATNTLKTNKRIQLAINICGPVVLLPQKSSSANVLIMDLGEFFAENFFKECSNDTVENILIKWNNISVTRGVVSLTSALEMQETLIEPVNLSVGVKRFTNIKTYQKHWDVDGVMDKIQITLGQKDLSIILSTYSENIAEGKIIDLFPYAVKSQTNLMENDDTVKNLEAFFCEPKQKNIVMKFSLDGVKLLLFFDSGELLSSPIRDLNHGLCTLEIQEINTSAVIYTDRSLDGKLSVDTIFIEEIGPEASSCGKGVLQSPMDGSKNNNCNITVNKPPIIDITFHQNKSGDKSMDIIIGKLSLNLSVPFCEKVALFIVECLPRDHVDIGIINHGYEADLHQTPSESHQENKSLAISLRINKPEFVFLIETTSNKKRYFITKCEILSDYSRHSNQLNFVVSLSGFHTLFYDLGSNNSPYTILKHCDMEFSKCYLQDKSDKITLSISSFYIQLCSTVVHSINDVLNDIIEHFKVPELELKLSERRKSSKAAEIEDIWEPKVLTEFVSKLELLDTKLKPAGNILHELLIVPNFDIIVIFELEEIQVLILKITAEITAHNWSSLLNCTCELSIQANYYNESLQGWEPLIDPVVVDEKEYKPWDILIKVFQDKALPMISSAENKLKKEGGKGKKTGISGVPSEDDEDSGENMVYLEPMTSHYNRTNRRVKTSLSTFLDDSDSESEDNAMEKLAAAISDLFTGDWNESEDSDCEHSSDADDESDENIKVKPEVETVDLQFGYKKSINILIDAKETLNITVTPTFLKLLNEILTIYSNKTLSVISDRKSINVTNDIGPQTKVELYEKNIIDDTESDVLVCSKTYEKEDSAPSSPLKSQDILLDYLDDTNEDKDSSSNDCENLEILYDVETVSSLQFPIETTSQLFEKLNKHFLKIHIPNFLTLQTNCSKNNWEKLMRLRSQSGNQIYHIAAKHVIGKYGRNIVISSPLQIKNETCFALSLLYEPSVLQMLNLEPLGDITNPFETTMRIAVLEAYEQYNVPLYIAYHCKLFIQPAYAEGHYVSNTAIWWQDLASELDLAYNLLCTPKTESNLEVFSLRVIMKRNFEITNSLAQLVPNYVIHLLPPLILHNNLPYAIDVENIGLKQVIKVDPGEKSSVYCLDLSKDQKLCVKINFQSQVWSGTVHLTSHLDEKIVVLTTENKESCKHLAINIKTDRETSCNIFFYTPYWIVNKTGLPLQIKATATNSVYESANEDILLFTYKRHGKQTLSVQVYESNWSNEFGLECAGTTGLVVCKDVERKKKYLFFLNIALSNICPRLTKIVMILPSFLVCNNTTRSLRFMENNEKTDLWHDLSPYQTVIFWPETFSMQMYVKYRDSKNFSQAFFIASQHQTVLKMDKGTAITVRVTGGKTGPFRVTFNEYRHGDCPVYIRNYCTDLYLKIQQQGQSQVTLLNPNHGLLYTWDDPTKPREFIWNVYNNKTSGYTIDILKDGYGEERIRFNTITSAVSAILSSSSDDSDSSDSVKTAMKKNIRKDKIVIYWICYRGGAQRTLVFTQEPRLFNQILNNYFHELCDFECLVSFSGLGFSIFTSETAKKEHMYLSLLDIPAIWEVNIGHKWKTLTLELASWIEDKYRMHAKKCQVKDYIHIDFEKMFMLKPFFAELRRTYYPSLYFHFRKSLHYHYLNAKVHSIQIDNRYSNDVVLYTELADNSKSNCFLDLMLCRNSSRDCDIYKNIKISIGNVFLNIEYDLFTKLYNLMGYNKKFLDESTTAYRHDMTYIHALITAPQKTPYELKISDVEHGDVVVNNNDLREEMSSNKMTIIENFTFSGFNIQLNISGKTQRCLLSNRLPFNKVLDYLCPVNISPYMPMEGVHHKIYSIEETDLNDEISSVLISLWNQTSTQFLQQYYSLVLGQQVLVNPFALQSVQAVETAQSELEKMANVSLYGSRCLLGHINMSPAALEQCITDIFINQNIETIQRIRRHGSYYKTKTLPKVITASCRNFKTGVPNALSQLIVKNQNSSLNCDAEMFFKTTGKALLSLVTRHPDDKSNSVEVAKEALRRATLLGEPIRIHQRLTRYNNKYLGIKPFSNFDSIGTYLLETVGNGRFVNDTYWTHAPTDDSGKSVILVSLEHIIKLSKCRLWGPWEIEWSIAIDDVDTLPKVSSTELIIKLRDIEKNNVNQVNICGDKETLLWLHEKIGQAIIVSIENKSWSVTDM